MIILKSDLTDIIFDEVPIIVAKGDAKGTIVFVNPRAESVLGYIGGELLGKSVDILVPEIHRPFHQNYRQDYNNDPKRRVMADRSNLTARMKDGTFLPVRIHLTPHYFQGELAIVALFELVRKEGLQ